MKKLAAEILKPEAGTLREAQKQNAVIILKGIDACECEEDIEILSDLAEELVQAKYITKKAYKHIEEELDCRISWLVEQDLKRGTL